jgi:hypothetical protein
MTLGYGVIGKSVGVVTRNVRLDVWRYNGDGWSVTGDV